MEWLFGWHPVREALRARRRALGELRIRSGAAHAEQALVLAAAAGVRTGTLVPARFDEIVPAGVSAQGVALECGAIPETGWEGLLTRSAPAGRCVVALDGVEDPQNVGAIARSAEGAGATGLLMTTRRAPPLSAALSRASAGAIEHLPVARAANLGRALEALKAQGFWVVGADSGSGDDLFASPDRVWEGDLVLVMGAEGRGLRPGIAGRLDFRVRIPMAGSVESLNVAAAAALFLYEWRRRQG